MDASICSATSSSRPEAFSRPCASRGLAANVPLRPLRAPLPPRPRRAASRPAPRRGRGAAVRAGRSRAGPTARGEAGPLSGSASSISPGSSRADHRAASCRVRRRRDPRESARRLDPGRTLAPWAEGKAGPTEPDARERQRRSARDPRPRAPRRPRPRPSTHGRADVVIESFMLGTMGRWGLDYASGARASPHSTCRPVSRARPDRMPYRGYGSLAAALPASTR